MLDVSMTVSLRVGGFIAFAVLGIGAHAETIQFQQSSGAYLSATVTATGSAAWNDVNQSQSVDLPSGANWAASTAIWQLPSTAFPIDPSKVSDPCQNACSPYYGGVYGSPSTNGAPGWETTPFWTVFAPTAQGSTVNQAELDFGKTQSDLSLLWGSPDDSNLIQLLLGGSIVAQFSGSDFGKFSTFGSIVQHPGQGDVLFSLSGIDFDSVLFSATKGGGTFEFSNLASVAAVPVPATAILLLSAFCVIALGRRRVLGNSERLG